MRLIKPVAAAARLSEQRPQAPAMTSSTPTAASAMIDFADLAAQAAAGPDVLAYLKARGIDRTATLALIASVEDAFIRVVADPFVNGHKVGGTTHKAKHGEGDIARAILLHMWMEARRQWQAHVALPTPSPPTPATTTTTSTTSSSADEKPPKHFTAWAQCVENYNAKLLDGKLRRFPTDIGFCTPLSRAHQESCIRPSASERSCHAGLSRPARP